MKKIFSLPTISINSRKQSEFYSENGLSADYSNSSIDLTDEKRIKLEQLQTKLSALYEELDTVLIKEEELTVLNYRNKKRKIEPISNFRSSIESLNRLNESKNSSNNSSSKSLNIEVYRNGLKENNNLLKINKVDKDEIDYNSNFNDLANRNEIKEITLSKFYFPLNELNLTTNQQNLLTKSNEKLEKELRKSEKKINQSKSFNVINRNRFLNSPISEKDENSISLSGSVNAQTNLLNGKINVLEKKLSTVTKENDQLKSSIKIIEASEKEMKLSCRRMEEKIRNQKDKIDELQTRLTESVSNHNKSKVEFEQFKIEMQIEREKFTNFVLEETRFEQRNNEKQLKDKLKDKDHLIANLIHEIDNLKLNLKNQNITIDLIEKNQLLSSQKISFDQTIRNISIYQKNNIPEMLMINLDDNISQLSRSQLNNSQLDKSNSLINNSLKNDRSMNNETINNQSTSQLNSSVRQFCNQINLLQKEFSLIVDEEEKRNFMIKIEDYVLKNMRKLVVDRMDSFFSTLQLYLAQLKFEIIQFAIDNEQKRQKSNFINKSNTRKSASTIEWLKLMTGNSTNTNKKHNHHPFLDYNNNFKSSINYHYSNLRNNNLQSRTVERRMIELRRSIETYLKSYLVRILLEMQEQSN